MRCILPGAEEGLKPGQRAGRGGLKGKLSELFDVVHRLERQAERFQVALKTARQNGQNRLAHLLEQLCLAELETLLEACSIPIATPPCPVQFARKLRCTA